MPHQEPKTSQREEEANKEGIVFVAILLGLALTAFCVGPSQAAG